MSIYASLEAPTADHTEDCAIWVERPSGSGCFEYGDEPCSCRFRNAPIVYEGSHILPADDDRRDGGIDLALIPGHITRDGRDDLPEDGPPRPWLRLGVHSVDSNEQLGGEAYVDGGDATVILDRRQVEQIRDTLTWWLDETGGSPTQPNTETK